MPPKAEMSHTALELGRDRLQADAAIGVSYRDATGTNTMAETISIDRPSGSATVRASALAQHLDCSRTYIGKLEAKGVIQRQGDGFSLDQSRVAYLRYLRRERRQSPRSEAHADHVKVKTEILQLRLMEKRRDWCGRRMSMH
jgi:hypothetical protein